MFHFSWETNGGKKNSDERLHWFIWASGTLVSLNTTSRSWLFIAALFGPLFGLTEFWNRETRWCLEWGKRGKAVKTHCMCLLIMTACLNRNPDQTHYPVFCTQICINRNQSDTLLNLEVRLFWTLWVPWNYVERSVDYVSWEILTPEGTLNNLHELMNTLISQTDLFLSPRWQRCRKLYLNVVWRGDVVCKINILMSAVCWGAGKR